MRNVVVDTNVLIRAFLKRENSDGIILQKVIEKDLQLWYSNGLLHEVARVLTYPRLARYSITQEAVNSFIKMLIVHGKIVIPKSTTLCRDPDDNEVLGIAFAVAVDTPVCLISADKDLLALKRSVTGVRILTPQEFLK